MSEHTPETVVLVVHGSRSGAWVQAQENWFAGVSARLEALDCRLSYLEITTPLFRKVLEDVVEFDVRPFIFPFFLSQSGHAGDEIPEIAEEVLGPEQFDLIAPDGWPEVLGRNVARRLRALGTEATEPVIVSGYGASHHDELWQELLREMQPHTGEYAAAEPFHWAPSGHFLADSAEPLRLSLRAVEQRGLRRCTIVPLYLAVSSYQESLIPGVIAEFPNLEVRFVGDSILPDSEIEGWAADLVRAAIAKAPRT